MDHRYFTLGMSDVNLGFAGSKHPNDRIHAAIAHLQIGDPLRYAANGNGIELQDASGAPVARLAGKFAPPAGLHCIQAHVHAIVTWRKIDSDPKYLARCRCEAWEVIVPELVFAP